MSRTHREPREARRPHKRRLYRAWFPCGAKRCFADEIAARVGGMLSIEDRRNVTQLWVYRCKRCKRWHLTSQDLGSRWAVVQQEKKAA